MDKLKGLLKELSHLATKINNFHVSSPTLCNKDQNSTVHTLFEQRELRANLKPFLALYITFPFTLAFFSSFLDNSAPFSFLVTT